MANELEFIINKRSFRAIDTTTKVEYFSVFVDQFKWRRDDVGNFTFFNSSQTVNAYGAENLNRLGINQDPITGKQTGTGLWLFSNVLDPSTGVKFASADIMAAWLGDNTGFFFNPSSITVDGISELVDQEVYDDDNIVVYLREISIDLKINNKYLSMLLNEEVTKRDLK
tara:strand:+ start:731 stop:1237 length:507 start_codon:yes stop_codon:yes gene_type:complete